MIILFLLSICLILFLVRIAFTKCIWYDKKHGMKYTLTDSGLRAEMDFNNPITLLKFLRLFIKSEVDSEQRKKYIFQYNKLKNSLEKDGYDVSDFKNFEKED